MTIIRTRLPDAQEAYRRHISREKEANAKMLQVLVNRYLIEFIENGEGHPVSQTTYTMGLEQWRSHCRKWNRNQSRLAELRETDYEELITHIKEKRDAAHKKATKRRIFKYISLRPFFESVWVGCALWWECLSNWMHKDIPERQ